MSTFKLSLTSIKSTRPSDYSVNRLYPNPKIAINQTPSHIGVLEVNVIGGPSYNDGDIATWYSFPHPYNYAPTVVGIFMDGLADFEDGGTLPYAGFGALGQIFMDADEDNVNLKFESFDIVGGTPLGERHLRIRYYVFAEEAFPVS